jgi:polar amino acid transport system substrate-binding protein
MHASETTIRITNGEWEPYLSESSYQYGLASHIITEAFQLEGISIAWGFFPWKRSYELARMGHWDASAVWWPTEDAKRDFWISDPVVGTSFVYFYLKEKPFDWDSIDDLKGLKIGITLGYDYGEAFMSAMQRGQIQVDAHSQDELNYKKLLLGRIDVFPNDPLVGYAQIKNNFSPEEAERFTHHPKEFEQSTLSLIISRNTDKGKYFLEKFNAGLAKLKESGRLAQMLSEKETGKYDKQPRKWRQP